MKIAVNIVYCVMNAESLNAHYGEKATNGGGKVATYIVIFLIGVCIGGLGISLFSCRSYEKGYEDGSAFYKDVLKNWRGY